jgi:FlaA1/EpsC-like NDP-sugar epimerase
MNESTQLSLLGRQRLNRRPAETSLKRLTVLVTGAGGSIGRRLVSRLAAAGASELVLIERSEAALRNILRRLTARHPLVRTTAFLGDAGDADLLRDALGRQPQLIFHAAAFKHVDFLERQPFAAIQNNVLGTDTLLRVARDHRVPQLVLLSTDKAVRPASILGASKRIAELLCLEPVSCDTSVTTLRLCNVLGSSGSLLPSLQEQLRKREPLSISHADATRFFVTRWEAVDLLCSAVMLGQSGALYVPDVTPAIRVLDLATRLAARAGRPADVVFTELQPGEKLVEELWAPDSTRVATAAPPLVRVQEPPSPVRGVVSAYVDGMRDICRRRDLPALRDALRDAIPEFTPSSVIADAAEQVCV